MQTTTRLDYQELRSISPQAARQAILQILKANHGKVSLTARMLGITRRTVYKAIQKKNQGDLADDSKSAHRIHNKTPASIEAKVLALKQKTRYGPIRLAEELEAVHQIVLSSHTIRNILRRNKTQSKTHKPHKKGPRQFVDWYSAKPFEIVQIDLKYIIDQKVLTMEQIDHIQTRDLPIYQWGALDVNSRFKLIAYSNEKSWTNGLTWFLWVTSWLRSHGVTDRIVYTVDHGEEFGGKSWLKMVELRKLLAGFGCQVIQNHIRQPQENAHLERSHRMDDDEFYIPRIMYVNNRQELFHEAFNYLYYYNVVRKHSGIARQTPYGRLVSQTPSLNVKIKYVPPLILDNISVALGPWSGYHALAQYPVRRAVGPAGCRPLKVDFLNHSTTILLFCNVINHSAAVSGLKGLQEGKCERPLLTNGASAVVRQRIEEARAVQRQRFDSTTIQTNSDMGPGEIQRYCPVDQTGRGLLKAAMAQLHLSARAYHRILKLARTIADLAASETIEPPHLAEAIQYRPRRQL